MELKRGTFCPLIKKDCVQLQCAWFTQLRGTHPQTGQEIDDWMCAITSMPMLQIEVAKQARSGAAATESFRNEVVRESEQRRSIEAFAAIEMRKLTPMIGS